MCYALLTTCHTCAWTLRITYPRCSHAKAYAIDPPACPYRMKRRYKSSGLCSACAAPVAQDTEAHVQEGFLARGERGDGGDGGGEDGGDEEGGEGNEGDEELVNGHRKDSLSITPCEVRIAFRNTEVGSVDAGDRVRNLAAAAARAMGSRNEYQEGGTTNLQEGWERAGEEKEKKRKTRTRKGFGTPGTGTGVLETEAEAESSADETYIDSPSASLSASSSSAPPTEDDSEDDSEDEDAFPSRKYKGKALPKPKERPRKRRRSPGVLERIQAAHKGVPVPAAVRKGKRGRPPKAAKMMWPDRIDGGVVPQGAVVARPQERKVVAKKQSPMPVPRTARPMPVPVPVPGLPSTVEKLPNRPVYVTKMPFAGPAAQRNLGNPYGLVKPRVAENVGKAGPPGVSGGGGELDDLARIIAMEASKRDKKWR